MDVIGPRLSFFFNAHLDFLEEMAKYRAARRLWARIMKERFGAQDPRSLMVRFHTQTAGCSLDRPADQEQYRPGGLPGPGRRFWAGPSPSIPTPWMRPWPCLPKEAVQIALRTQQLIAYETGVTETVDPLGGSYYIEHLTNTIENQAADYIRRIDELGGAASAIEQGFVQREIQESAYKYQKAVEQGDRIVVGLNKFQVQEPKPTGSAAGGPGGAGTADRKIAAA